MIHYSFLESIMEKSKQKCKSTREPQLSANSISARKRDKQDLVHRIDVTYIDIKTRGDVYGNVKKTSNDAIAVSPRMPENSPKCTARRHKQKISNNNNQMIDIEEAEKDKSEHKPSVLGLICTTAVNGGRPKILTLKNKKTSKTEWMKRSSISLVFSWRKRRILRASQQEPYIYCTTMS